MTTTRGTSNTNVRGSAADRRARRAYLIKTYASDVPGYARCYRCGCLLYNPDDVSDIALQVGEWVENGQYVKALTVDRVTPGCQGGTYRRNNIRPACGPCNSETGANQRRRP